MSKLLAPGAVPAPVNEGLKLPLEISKDGRVAPTATLLVRMPSWKGNIEVTFSDLRHEGGTLNGSIKLNNKSGLVLQGLRFDAPASLERYSEPDPSGKDVIKTRAQGTRLSSPLLFGDLQPDEVSETHGFQVSGIQLKPETIGVTIGGHVSGLALIATHNPVPDLTPVSIDFDSRGQFYLAGSASETVYRYDPAAKKATPVATLPQGGISIAYDRANSLVYATANNQTSFFKFTADGKEKGQVKRIDEMMGFNDWSGKARFGQDGRIYVNFGNGIARLDGEKPEMVVYKVGDFEFESYLSYDVSPDGSIWVGTKDMVHKLDPAGKSGKLMIKGPSTQLGHTNSILALRLNASGQVFIAEDMGPENWPRVSVFDGQGRLIRVFGRATQKARKEDEEFRLGELVPGAIDFAFDSTGKLYLVHAHLEQSMLVFEPF